ARDTIPPRPANTTGSACDFRSQTAFAPRSSKARTVTESTTLVEVRPLDFDRDVGPLKAFLAERDRLRLDHLEAAVGDRDAFALVADEGGTAVGWAVVHVAFRDDQDWDPPDDDTRNFQKDDNAYLENIEVTARSRSGGVGSKLLRAAEDEARRRGKKKLWL